MLTNAEFYRVSKRGHLVKVIRERYLRDDIETGLDQPLPDEASKISKIVNGPHFLIPDTNVLLHQMDILEDERVKFCIITQTVLEEVRGRSITVYKRIRDLIRNKSKAFFVYINEFSSFTYVERLPGESVNDRNDRAIRKAAIYYHQLIKEKRLPVHVLLLTDDRKNLELATSDGILAFTTREYVNSIEGCPEIKDKLSLHDQPSSLDEILNEKNRVCFPEHLPLSEVQRRVKTGALLQGKFQTSRDNYLEGVVMVQSESKYDQVLVHGYRNLNRVVHEDIVAIEVLPKSQWRKPSNMIVTETEEEDELTEVIDEPTAPLMDESDLLPTGRIVGIIKRSWRMYCGVMQKSSLSESVKHIFVPSERRIPKIRIETRQAAALANQRIVVAIDAWPRSSLYPQGHIVRALGDVADKATENEVILLEHEIPHHEFSQAVLDCLPKLPWTISPEELARREDLRHVDICSVDPPGCTDIDDALHCKRLPNGNFESGVHIADVTHFVQPGLAMDKEASERGTTVYLVDRRIDMLPELLSSNLCSLRENEDRFAFSVIWEMDDDANVITTRFCKSIIRSKASLTYGQAQMMMDDAARSDALAVSLRNLNYLAKKLKLKRAENGALTLASAQVRFELDSETHDPIDVQNKELGESNYLVEEFMLLANVSVAAKIHEHFPESACLRRHPTPAPSNFDPVIKAAKSMGFDIDVSTSRLLAQSLDAADTPAMPYFNTLLRILTTRCMTQAVYFCGGTIPYAEFKHYGLAAPIYTHFTSPIRRYADVMVHRFLAAAVYHEEIYPALLDKKLIQSVCQNLNHRHRMGQYAGRASVKLHTILLFRGKEVEEEAYIMFVKKNAIQAMVPRIGLEGTVFVEDKKGRSPFVFNEEEFTLTAGDVKLRSFDRVRIRIAVDSSNQQHQKLDIKLVEPKVPGWNVDSQVPAKKLKTDSA